MRKHYALGNRMRNNDLAKQVEKSNQEKLQSICVVKTRA